MKSDRTWLIALAVAAVLAVGAAVFVLRAYATAMVPEADVLEVVELTPQQKEDAARTADLRCVYVERFVVRGGDPLTGSLHVMKKLCAAKVTAVLVDGVGPNGERAHLEQKLDLALSGDDLIELRDDEAHDAIVGWTWTVELQFETALNPGLRSAFCSKGAAGPAGLKCQSLDLRSE